MTAKQLAPYLDRVSKVELPPTTCGCAHCMKAAKQPGGETVPKDDHFIKEELALAALLLALWEAAVASTGIEATIKAAGATRNVNVIDTTLENADEDMAKATFTDEGKKESEDTLHKSFMVGFLLAGAAAAAAARMAASIKRTLFGYNSQVGYWTNHYFARIAHPALMEAVLADGVSITGTNDLEAVLEAVMARVIKGTEVYWRIVANQTMSRAHHYGILRGAQEQGKLGYRLVAVIDLRTTDLCRGLDGKEFWVADAIEHLERVAETDPADIGKVAPWVKWDDVKGKSNAELSSLGVLCPPFHSFCRTTLVAFST